MSSVILTMKNTKGRLKVLILKEVL